MAVNSKDIETLWQQYREDGANHGVSVAQYFESNGIPYHTFEKWYKKKYSPSGVVDCVVSVLPDSPLQVSDRSSSVMTQAEKHSDVYVSYINIGLSNGLKLEHHRLSYVDLVCFINKLQSLCSA